MTQSQVSNSDIDNSQEQEQKQPKRQKQEKIVQLDERGKIEYDMPKIENFFDVVFHDLQDDEHILSWSQRTSTPSFPKPLDKTLGRLKRTGLARACYFSTSTVVPDEEDGQLYNRKKSFKRLHVVVLDDIGTKVRKDKLPEDLIPNYIIETSEGNFQYGFILETPIEDYDLAEALIHLVYTSGYCDTGGKMPNKVVRMPCGINGKEGEKGDFQVTLHELNNEYWTPEELLDVLDIGVSWADVEADVSAARQGRSARFVGTSLWSPIKPTAASLNGVVDPILEWLYENDMVKHDNGQWVTIECPWGHEHSNEDNTAGYSPVGRGGQYSNSRGFHCFHDHCSDRTAHDFLKEIAQRSGIQVPVIDNVADLVADYAYVAAENSVYRVRGVNKPVGMKIEAFKNLHPKKVQVFDSEGKVKTIAESALWLSAPNRLSVQGLMSDPTSQERVIEHDGLRYLNTYAPPPWGKGDYDKEDVETFKQFLNYLIPNDDEREYFLQWLAAKAQKSTFKGAAILMVAPTQGTGRTTLTDMVTQLFTPNNVKKVTFPQLCGATDAGAYNDWLESDIVTCDEIMSHQHNKHKVYESLKDLFDPRPKTMVINTKYGSQRPATLYTSYLLLTNHIDAIGALGDDRRIYVIQNTMIPNGAEYFTELNRWLSILDDEGQPRWIRNVWRWLQTLKPDLELLNSPAPSTQAKQAMINATKSEADLTAIAIMDFFGGVIPTAAVETLAREVLDYKGVTDAEAKAKVVDRLCRNLSQPTELRARLNGKRVRLRISFEYLKERGIGNFTQSIEDSLSAEILAVLDSRREKFEKHYDDLLRELVDYLDNMHV